MKWNNPILLDAATNSGTKYSPILDASHLYNGSFQIYFSDGSAAGTVVLQGSNDPQSKLPGNEDPQNWNDIANTSTSVTSGSSKLVSVAQLNYRWIRLKWTQSGGAGTVTANGFFFGF